MNCTDRAVRWTTVCRWAATLGIGAIALGSYVLFQPAAAQDKGPAAKGPAAAAAKTPAAKPAGDAPLSEQQIGQLAEAALAESEQDKKDAKVQPFGTGSRDTLDIIKDIQWVSPHMWAVYAILVVSLVSATFALERFLGLRRSRVLPADLTAGLRALAGRKGEFDLRHAQRLCKQYPSSAATVVRAMLGKVGRPVPEIEQAMSQASDKEASRLYANVRWQNLAFNVAPMLGLAGTVHGMIIAFFVTAHMPLGANKMESLATGIYAALVCTFAGLMVAIPAGVLAHFFEGRILKLFYDLDDITRSLIPHLERFEGRPRMKSLAEKTLTDKAPAEHATVELPKTETPPDGASAGWSAIAPGE